MTGAADPRYEGGADGHRSDSPADRIVAGTVLGGKYRLISEIGRGGMGAVWRAEHLAWEAPVALKIMNRDITAHPEAVARFEREVRLAAGLRSPHVVQVLDHGLDEATRTPYIAMELLEGESLARRLKRIGRISPAETFHVFSQLVRALTRAHAAGIVHRDLKPDNVFLVRNEEESLTKVLDFGVAKWTAPDVAESGLTRPGSVVGTPYYMSPEQIQGSREIDHRADLWALAAIACECLTGRRPFEAPDFAQLAVLLVGNTGRPLPSSLGPVPQGFDAWFLRATDPDISRRFQTAREMAQTLAPLCDVAPSSAGGDPYPAQALSSTRLQDAPSMAPVSNTASRLLLGHGLWQRPMLQLVLTTVFTTLLGTGGVAYWLSHRSSDAAAAKPSAPPALGASPPAPVTPSTKTTKLSLEPKISPVRDGSQSHQMPVRPTPVSQPERADVSEPDPSDAPEARPDGWTPPPSADDTTATERSVRHAMLVRPGHGQSKSKKPRADASRSKSAKKPEPEDAPPPRALRPAAPVVNAPPAASAAPAAPAPKLVDGRVIRTNL